MKIEYNLRFTVIKKSWIKTWMEKIYEKYLIEVFD